MSYNFLISGATSFAGVEICREVLRRGHVVTAICREGSKGEANLPEGVRIVHATMDDYGRLSEMAEAADVFINLAWEGTAKGQRDDSQLQERNVVNTLAAIRSAAALGCKLFVETGSQAEYGIVNEKISEDRPCAPVTGYGKAKLQVREEGAALCAQLGMKYLHLRIFSLFGENDHPVTLVMSVLDKMLRNEAVDLSRCEHNWNFLYCPDAAVKIERLCEYALENEAYKSEVFNIASRDTRKLKEFVASMQEIAGSKSELRYGAIEVANPVSLDPDMSKLEGAVGKLPERSFEDVVRLIVRQKRGRDNFFNRAIDFFLSKIQNKFIRFCFVGCLNAGFGWGVYCLAILVGLPFYVATLVSNVLGVLWNFMTTGTLVFENREKKLIFRFIVCYIINYFINTGAVKLFLSFGVNNYWSGLLATPIAAICSFFLLKFLVYKK